MRKFLRRFYQHERGRSNTAARILRAVIPVLCICGGLVSPADASIWSSSVVPAVPDVTGDTLAVNLGLQFYSDVSGTVTAVRFYKGSSNTGTHVGTLWSSTGAKLGSVQFSGETASGWQQAAFSTPIPIAAKTTYVVSYVAPHGAYADDQNYAWSNVSASPLHVSGSAPGVYVYGSTSVLPTSAWNNSNYYVDLVFVPSASSSSSPPATYSISGTVSGSGATLTLSGTSSASTTTSASGTFSFSSLANGSYVVAPSKSGYTFSPSSAAVSVNGANVTGVNFTASTAATVHTVSLTWNPSTSSNITGYKVYRGTVSGGPYTLVSTSLLTTCSYSDSTVSAGKTYYYVTTAVNSSNLESGDSNQTVAIVPTP